jgi:hypothetical protein
MAKKKVDAEIIVEASKAKKEVKTMQVIIEENNKAKEAKRKKLAEYKKVECPALNLRQLYNFTFNEGVKNPFLRNVTREVTGELAMHFIKSNYGVLC